MRFTSCLLGLALSATLVLGRKYPTSGLYNVDENVGLQDLRGTVVAFADFNGDKYTDLITISSDQTSFSVYLWDHAAWSFALSPTATIQIDQSQGPFIITNIVPGDFNHDGRLDVLVMGQQNPAGQPQGELMMRVYLRNTDDSWNPQYVNVPSSTSQQPLTFDVNGDMLTDLLGHPYDQQATQPKKLFVWKNIYTPEVPDRIFEVVPMNFTGTTTPPECALGDPHSSAFVDLDGDCLADIFLTCSDQTYQVFINKKETGFEFARSGVLPTGAGQVTFADMDGDGAVDMVIPAYDRKSWLYINYNIQMPLCTSKDQQNCRQATNLCVADPNFSFSDQSNAGGPLAMSRIDLTEELPPNQHILLSDPMFKGTLPISVHVGDYNLDGYPDLLVVSTTGDGVNNGHSQTSATLLQSVLCANGECYPDDITARHRTFVKVADNGATALTSLEDVKAAAFFDLDEDGTLDIMVLRNSAEQEPAARVVTMIHNNYFNDAFFLKTLASNGVCPSWCGLDTRPVNSGAKPFGVNYPGATFKFTILDTSGRKRANQVAQYPSASYVGLQLPYSLFGLGRTNNYVEELFVGVTRNQSQHYTTYSGVIPNSQLIIIPYQAEDASQHEDVPVGSEPSGQDKGGPYEWTLELYVRPGDYVPWVFVVLATAIAMLAGVVVGLNWMEKREDEHERKKALHIINFDAL